MLPAMEIEHDPADGALGQVINGYLEARRAGLSPDRSTLCVAHPELAAELERFFAAHDEVERLSQPLREVAQAARVVIEGDDSGSGRRCLLATPQEFGDYVLLEVLGSGGMGRVYRARHQHLKRDVALKQISRDPLASEAELRRFRNEAEAAASLEHPNVVPIHEVGEHRGRHYLTMRLMEGGSLAEVVVSRQLSVVSSQSSVVGSQLSLGSEQGIRWAAQFVATVARAIHHAHQRGILHRDLKPSNILLDSAGTAHVTDFGLARRIGEESTLTASDVIVGTPSYMAPEQAAGHSKEITTGTDVYGLGAILYALLTAQAPFRGDSALETLEQVRSSAPESPRRFNPCIDRDLATICLKCLEKEPGQRYPSAVALAEDLGRWLEGKPIVARPVGPVVKGWRWARRNRVVAGLVVSVAALLTAWIAGLVVSRATIARQNAEIIRQRDRADARLQLAHIALEMITAVAEVQLPEEPRTEKARRKILEDAAQYYKELAKDDSGDPAARYRVGTALLRRGKIQALLVDTESALKSLREARVIFEALAAASPSEMPYQYGRLEACLDLATVLEQTNAFKEAEDLFGLVSRAKETLLTVPPGDRTLRNLVARSDYKLGELLRRTNRLVEAEQVAGRAVSGFESLARAFPEVPGYQSDLGAAELALGAVLYDRRKRVEAGVAYRRSVATLQKLADDPGAPSEVRDRLAGALHSLAVVLHETNQPADSESTYLHAIAFRGKLAADYPLTPRYKEGLVKDLVMLGALYAESGRLDMAVETLERALAMQEKLKADYATVPAYRETAGEVRNNLAEYLTRAGRNEDAQRLFLETLAERENLANDYPGNADYLARWGKATGELAEFERIREDFVAARDHADQAIVRQQAALEAGPETPLYHECLRDAYVVLAESLAALGERDRACESAREALRAQPDWSTHHHLARVWARCARRVEHDPKLPAAQRQALLQSYADRAMEMLRQAVQRGFRQAVEMGRHDVNWLAQDKDFDVIRAREEFKQLIRHLQAKAP
jgi:tetratricopeptide (TPR) repeat protein/tRNA A-37 threonylcarbamoyl transferase component Bud32